LVVAFFTAVSIPLALEKQVPIPDYMSYPC